MPPKKKKKPDSLGQYRAGQRDSGFDIGGSGTGGGGGPVRGGGWLGKATRAYQKLWGVNQRRSGGGPKKPPGKKSTPKPKPALSAASRLAASAVKARRAANRKKMAQQATRTAVARRKAGIAAGQRASSAASPPPTKAQQAAATRRIAIDKVATGKGRAQLRRQAIETAKQAAGVVQRTAQASGSLGKPSFPVAIQTRNQIKIGKDAIKKAGGKYDPFLGKGTGAQRARRLTEEEFGKPVPGSNPRGVQPKKINKKKTKKKTAKKKAKKKTKRK